MQIPDLQILGKTEDWSYTRKISHKSCDSVIVRSRVTAPLRTVLPFSSNILLTLIMLMDQGPVVQSIDSLTKSLVNDSLSLLVRLKSSVLIFFAEKM